MRRYITSINHIEKEVTVDEKGLYINEEAYIIHKGKQFIIETSTGKSVIIDDIIPQGNDIYRVEIQGFTIDVLTKNPLDLAISGGEEELKSVISPLAGVVSMIYVKEGDEINKGDVLVIISAMKMENKIVAKLSGTIKCINININEQINQGSILLELE